ncbi:MAG: aminotransferase class I/II-fold pyridoxal phosphate-dependent enzyme [bacterium]
MKGQGKAPLWKELTAHVAAGYTGFHVPGHKGSYGLEELSSAWGPEILNYDLTELPGLDNLHAPEGVIREAQELAAELYGARCTFFLVGGTSAGLIAALLAATRPGDKVILPRHAHRSLLSAAILGDLKPVFYPAVVDPVHSVVSGWDQDEALRIIDQHTDARALVLVHPSYHGLVGPAAQLIQAARRAGLTVIADEAHGPHFYLHSGFPPGALRLGADAAVQSTHKMLGSLTQSSWLHLGSGRISPARVLEVLRWLESSSPSYLLMASLDVARRRAALHGCQDWGRARQLAEKLRAAIAGIPAVKVMGDPMPLPVVDYDVCKIVVDVGSLGLTGPKAALYLNQKHKIQLEMAELYTLLFIVTPADDDKSILRAAAALLDLARRYQGNTVSRAAPVPPLPSLPVAVLSPRAAAFARHDVLPVDQAVDKIAAKAVVPYPPGIPLLWPGEQFSAETLEVITAYIRQGIPVQGLTVDANQGLNVSIVGE